MGHIGAIEFGEKVALLKSYFLRPLDLQEIGRIEGGVYISENIVRGIASIVESERRHTDAAVV
jgi:hypothetical protein